MSDDFRLIPSLENLYEVNADGTVVRNAKTKRPLKLFKKCHNSDTEYWCTQVNLHKKIRKVFVHRVVAECWLGQRPEGMQCDHIDRNSLNNSFKNLRYVTKSEQMMNRDYATFMPSLLENLALRNGGEMNPVLVIGSDGEELRFTSARKAAKWLAKLTGQKEKRYNDFFFRRKTVFDGFCVVYLRGDQLPNPEEEVNLHIKED